MTPAGKWILSNCDENLRISLSHLVKSPFDIGHAMSTCVSLGISIVGGKHFTPAPTTQKSR